MEGKQWELLEEKPRSVGVLTCLGNVRQRELLGLGRATLLTREMIISILDALCFKEHSSAVFSLQALT